MNQIRIFGKILIPFGISLSIVLMFLILCHSFNSWSESDMDTPRVVEPLFEISEENNHPYNTEDISSTFCINVITGTMARTITYEGVDGMSFSDYDLINFHQKVLNQSETGVTLETKVNLFLDTHDTYPVLESSLPPGFEEFLNPTTDIQSDDPLIISTTANLITDSVILQAQAVDSILTWVDSQTKYGSSGPQDASTVIRTHQALCGGYSNLAVAMMRSVGIPARVTVGCAGGWHAWIEVYYPQLGWVASDPQNLGNFIYPGFIYGWNADGCWSDYIIVYQKSEWLMSYVYNLRTKYIVSHDEHIGAQIFAASVPAWDRNPLSVSPISNNILLPITNPYRIIPIKVNNISCRSQEWTIESSQPWIQLDQYTGSGETGISLTIDLSGKSIGNYSATITITSPWLGDEDPEVSRSFPIEVRIVEKVFYVNMPIIQK